ncbi:hypothetical protein [Dyella mobilis]|uniref:Uncharacterized protein n=1 Tax=Dyella mobilis TaxID=1849582 RepID=A0ABS2KI98_9GAMM|nr:hypothetical protein [Dyella mobilis]MBM7130648.1 hypothetical protein [Dyella mobilis]GLQ97275.1 hypothetical protein GCM10007863_16950 [Dyella mobilis]
MSKSLSYLKAACRELGLQIEPGFVIKTQAGAVQAEARIVHLGSVNGMLIFSNYSQLREHQSELLTGGYGFSVLDTPLHNETYDLESYIEMFRDWGWAGPEAERPEWMDE